MPKVSRFKNLRKFEIHGIWFRTDQTARYIASVLRNSPKLTEFSISPHEYMGLHIRETEVADPNRDKHVDYDWETGQIGGLGPRYGRRFYDRLYEEYTRDQRLSIDLFRAICVEFRYPKDPSTGYTTFLPQEPTPPLALTSLHVVFDCSSLQTCRLRIDNLTDCSVLQRVSLHGYDLSSLQRWGHL
ncbi:hypothetical protein VTL71DRAFT_1316 [Oculimacula yallundae]|uniref:Uncharacterized protein n=1 Tax=Oculimacula yallundae TaxID=86028 RepID=A0ABR4CAC2_9HELO